MAGPERNMHYVCTHAEARALTEGPARFWVTNCGCRAGREDGECARSPVDVCLFFGNEEPGMLSPEGRANLRELSRDELARHFALAAERGLVTRPFRNPETMEETVGVCFCCDDCCAYFLQFDPTACDKGASVQRTDAGSCTDCGDCVAACYFGARTMSDEALAVDEERCFGCGLCVAACPERAIAMVLR